MSAITVSIELKALLMSSSIELTTSFNGFVEDALLELKTNDPDVGLVESYLTPVTMLTIPSVCWQKVVRVHKDRVLFSCTQKGPTLTRLAGYCDRMNINYTLGEK